MTVRSLVVGGGIVGLCVAYRLMRRGARVRVLQAARPSASLAAAGMLPPALEAFEADEAHPDLPSLLKAGADLWPSFAAELAGPGDAARFYRKTGSIFIASNDAAEARFAALAATARRMGVAFEALDGAAARKLEPELSADARGALHFSDDALVEPALLIAALTEALIHGGAEIVSNVRVTSVATGLGGTVACSHAGGVENADAIVLAPGWSAPALAPELGALFPVKGQILTVTSSIGLRHMMRGESVYLAPRGDGRIEIGATSERGFADLSIEPQAIVALQDKAAALAPALCRALPIAARAGVRPAAPDHAPLLGPSRLGDGVYLAAGAYRNGFLLAPLIADILTDAILGGAGQEGWLQRFSAQRFGV